MDANYFREKAALCLRLADGLSLNNPGRFQLMDLADDFKDRAKELETQTAQQRIDPRTGTIAKARGYTVERHESGSAAFSRKFLRPPDAGFVERERRVAAG